MKHDTLIKDTYVVDIANWKNNINELKMIRTCVFIDEQHVPVELEWDGLDEQCTHYIVRSNDKAVATARLSPDGQIGRMAVLSRYRKLGIGKMLILKILSHAKESGHNRLFLHAQIQATGFYKKHGFKSEGDMFMDAGIPHIAMYRNID